MLTRSVLKSIQYEELSYMDLVLLKLDRPYELQFYNLSHDSETLNKLVFIKTHYFKAEHRWSYDSTLVSVNSILMNRSQRYCYTSQLSLSRFKKILVYLNML